MTLRRKQVKARIVDLDDPAIPRAYKDLFTGKLKDRPVCEMVWALWRIVLRQTLHNKSLVLHVFYDPDDDGVRIHAYQPVFDAFSSRPTWVGIDWSLDQYAEDNQDDESNDDDRYAGSFLEALAKWCDAGADEPIDEATARREWIQFFPFPGYVAPELFRQVRKHAGMGRWSRVGRLEIHYENRDISAEVQASRRDDLRIYFGAERAALLRKTRHQFEEICEPQPDWQVTDIYGRLRAP